MEIFLGQIEKINLKVFPRLGSPINLETFESRIFEKETSIRNPVSVRGSLSKKTKP